MRISDWSSDVCSSDLKRRIRGVQIFGLTRAQYPPTKSNHAPSCIADRNHQSAAKPVTAFAFAIWIDQEPRFDEPQLAVALQRSEEHTSELQSLMRISYAVFCLKKKTHTSHDGHTHHHNRHNHNIRQDHEPNTHTQKQ